MPGLAADVTVELLRDSGTVASARVTSVGHRVVLHSRDLDVLVAGRSGGDLRTVAARLADDGWTLDVADDDGPILRLGAVPTHVWHRLATGSRYVQVLRWRAAARLKTRALTSGGDALDVPPPVAWPDLPTAPWARRRVTTTHDPYGGGHPRLYLSDTRVPAMAREVRVHHLALGETSIGAGEGCDLVLDDTSELQAVVTRTDDDEYVIGARGRATPTFVNGRELPVQTLRTGARIEVGPWRLTYVRDEFADHGRPFGGRQGGEIGRQRPQEPPQYQR
ncbi:hypothetical protein QE370_002668 [Aeromicrobium sp. SORGH_AS981]|uniref:FHA domain-containing protein n=1 Tax=Aeromicrobium sp. SORGH_AS_0981 TaxID=3041802 RepID=UPI00285E3959|nr:FHA domain-containing protein [Aeromicrobium sp. SORGH_AS_0981]MDR6119484.1 hypothetical protein [Aeromicrobium sp. SORGH_AS_0981]